MMLQVCKIHSRNVQLFAKVFAMSTLWEFISPKTSSFCSKTIFLGVRCRHLDCKHPPNIQCARRLFLKSSLFYLLWRLLRVKAAVVSCHTETKAFLMIRLKNCFWLPVLVWPSGQKVCSHKILTWKIVTFSFQGQLALPAQKIYSCAILNSKLAYEWL